jgi:hypothetical protein
MPGDHGAELWNGGLDHNINGMFQVGNALSRLAGSHLLSSRPQDDQAAMRERLRALDVSAARHHHAEQMLRASRNHDLLERYRQSDEPHPQDIHLREFLAGH